MTTPAPASRAGSWTLYRLFDGRAVLLYIGYSHRPGARMSDHEATASWWPQVRSLSFETYPTRAAARLAEEAAIKAEHPVHNKIRYRWQGPSSGPVPMSA